MAANPSLVRHLPPLPKVLEEYAHLNQTDAMTWTLYVDQRMAQHPVLMSWKSEVKLGGFDVTIAPVDSSELGQRRSSERSPDFAAEKDNSLFRMRAHEMVRKAATYGASDIHLQSRAMDGVVQFAVAGRLRVAERMSAEECKRLMRAFFQGVAQVTDVSYLESEPQNAQISGELFPQNTGLEAVRIVRGPCYPQHKGGEFMTLRLQYRGGYKAAAGTAVLPFPEKPPGRFELSKMGYLPSQLEKLNYLMACPAGLTLFLGPTGSGKTTSIYQFLAESQRQRPYRRLVTVEDPVEIPQDGGVQLCVVARNQESTAEAYALWLRTMLRMAPNVIFIGEIRDAAVAEIALEAAMTGHAGVSTLHVDEAFQFVDRLELMGRGSATLNRRVMCDPRKIRGVISQRLLAHLCDECALPLKETLNSRNSEFKLPDRILKALESWGPLDRVRVAGPGCNACSHTGQMGRYAVAEVVVTDTQLMSDYIHEGTAVAREHYQARADADAPLLNLAIARALAGKVDPREIELIDPVPMRPANSPPLPDHLGTV